jgi:hypothetical protein
VSPRVLEESVHPRLQSGASGRPLNFTVRPQVCPITYPLQRAYSVLRRATIIVWLAVSAVASLFFLTMCFGVPQLAPFGIFGQNCLGSSPKELQECADNVYRATIQLERREGIRGLLVFGSMVVVSAVLLRRERKRAAV